jgi:hypothetical protein
MEKIVVSNNDTIVVSQDTAQVVVTGILGPPGKDGILRISEASDLDLTVLENGSLLVYDTPSAKWKSTIKLERQILEAGQF